jgi:hypothetical protein
LKRHVSKWRAFADQIAIAVAINAEHVEIMNRRGAPRKAASNGAAQSAIRMTGKQQASAVGQTAKWSSLSLVLAMVLLRTGNTARRAAEAGARP